MKDLKINFFFLVFCVTFCKSVINNELHIEDTIKDRLYMSF